MPRAAGSRLPLLSFPAVPPRYLSAAIILLTALALILPRLPPPDAPVPGTLSPHAERVFYRGETSLEWGTLCRLGGEGYVSVHHVTKNGTPSLGPETPVTRYSEASDWSFLGIDPLRLDAESVPPLRPGMAVSIHGFPARDRDGEVIPGVVYIDDPQPPFWWIELRDSVAGLAAEGVIGGISGSCVLDEAGRVVAVVHANGFSRISGTTSTWAMVIPLREAIREAQGHEPGPPRPAALYGVPVPQRATGRWASQP